MRTAPAALLPDREDRAPMLTDCTTDTGLLGNLKDWSNDLDWQKFDDAYRPAIYCECRKLGLNPQDAGDITQEVIANIALAMRTFEYDPDRGRFRNWVRKICFNAVRGFQRRQTRRRDRAAGGGGHDSFVHNLPDARPLDVESLSDNLSQQLLERMWEVVERVKRRVRVPKRWQAFWGVDWEGRTNSEVAEKLGESVSYVWTAVKDLKAMLQKEADRLNGEAPPMP